MTNIRDLAKNKTGVLKKKKKFDCVYIHDYGNLEMCLKQPLIQNVDITAEMVNMVKIFFYAVKHKLKMQKEFTASGL